MKKIVKKAVFLGASLVSAAAYINKSIFDKASKNLNIDENRLMYDSLLGKASYIEKGNGNPILLIHNTNIGGSLKEYKRNIDELSKNFKVYALDLPGFGFSEKQNISYTAFPFAAFINSFIKDVIKEPVNIIASGGACVFCASAFVASPSNFLKAMFICPTGIFEEDLPTNSDTSFKNMLELPVLGTSCYTYFSSKRNLKKYLLNTALFSKENYSKELLNDLYESAHNGGTVSRFSFASEKSKFMALNILTLLEETDIPLYMVWGMDSEINPPTNISFFKNHVKNAKYAVFENAKILPHYEKADKFNVIAKEFFE